MNLNDRIRMQYIGVLSLATKNAFLWGNSWEADEARGHLEQALDDAKDAISSLRWKKTLHHYEIWFE